MSRSFAALVIGVVAGVAQLASAEVPFKIAGAKGAPIADAVVSLVPLGPVEKLAPPSEPVQIIQKNQEFSPYVTAILAGTRVVLPNQDTVQHTIYSRSKPKEFQFLLYDPGKSESLTFDKPGLVAIGCNIHDWMLSYVLVLDTPWFAKTPATGAAAIANVPPGRYRAEVWHPQLESIQSKVITVSEATAPTVAFDLELKKDQRVKRRVQAGSGGYK